MYQFIETIVDAFSHARSLPEVHQATLRLARAETGADVSVIGFEEDSAFRWLASEPHGWDDIDFLTSPAALPRVVASEGQSCIIDDRSDVRSTTTAVQAEEPASTVQYRSVMIVPYHRNGYLLAGAGRNSAFSQSTLDRLQGIATLSSLLHHRIVDSRDGTQDVDRMHEAASFLSHDATNLLSVINGRVELAKEAPAAADFEHIQQTLNRLHELIEATATLLETGSHVSDTEPTSLSDAANTAWGAVEAPAATIHSGPSATVIADHSRLCQLLENLFRNAVEHAGPDVTLWVRVLDGNRGFYVEDDGPGIDPEERDSLFQLGFSTDSDHTGIGLSIVQWIADAHDWDISVTEGSRGGARFEFRNVAFVDESSA